MEKHSGIKSADRRGTDSHLKLSFCMELPLGEVEAKTLKEEEKLFLMCLLHCHTKKHKMQHITVRIQVLCMCCSDLWLNYVSL